MKIIKSAVFTEEECDLFDRVLNLLEEYDEADIDNRYEQEQIFAREAHKALLDFWLSVE